MKTCSKCTKNKDINEFYTDKSRKDKKTPWCRQCVSNYQKTEAFKTINYKACKKYSKTTRAKELALKRQLKWAKLNAEKVRLKNNNYYQKTKDDPQIKLRKRVTSLAYRAVKNKARSSIDYLGCSLEQFKAYLENLFYLSPTTGIPMSWSNFGKDGWVIDHIKPICSFDLTKKEQLLECTNYKNLRPLWNQENLKKVKFDKKMAINKLLESGSSC